MTSNENKKNLLTEEMIKRMKEKNQTLYRALWGEQNNDFWKGLASNNIGQSLTNKDTKSNNSYSFYGADDKCELLKSIFGINNNLDKKKDTFKTKYNMAVSGSGQEERRITALHSSSLCALLFFYNVDEKHIKISLPIRGKEKTVTFTESVFEFKNKVLNAPSNIDVVLIGKVTDEGEDKNKTVLLFLESKFAEYYLNSEGTCDIGKGYLNTDLYKEHIKNGKIYELTKLKKLGLIIEESKRKNKKTNKMETIYKLKTKPEVTTSFYVEGIKQMISHYIGIKNLMGKKYYKSKRRQKAERDARLTEDENHKLEIEKQIQIPIENKIETGNCIVVLGGIVFKLPNPKGQGDLDEYTRYKDNYKLLAEIIAEQEADNSQFEILDRLLDYSELFTYKNPKYEVEPKIIDFYTKGLYDAGKPGILS